ncbi:MAG: hypothetical protein PVJ38_02295 [Candidatus Bathyarchaeota archaeon]|jgi:hypothetical protein
MPVELATKFVIGSCGALFTLYSNIGGDLPGMGKSFELKNIEVEIKELKDDIDKKEKNLDELQKKLSKGEVTVAQFVVIERKVKNQRESIQKTISELRDDWTKLRRNTNLRGAVIFVVLGAFLASFLTGGALLEGGKYNVQTVLSAFTIGAGWTGILSKYIQGGEIEKTKREIEKNVNEIEAGFNEAIKKKAEEYEEKLTTVLNEKSELAAQYNEIVDILKEKVDEGEEFMEKINKIKDEIKGTPIAEELAKLGFPI